MCDVRLIYLGNNKFSEIKCKPEVLSPLPKPKLFRIEQTPRTLVSLSEELVVGILDESQSSCTLVSLPHSPKTAKIELANQDMSLKLEEESNDTTLPVEMPSVNTANESHLIPQTAPTSSPTAKTSQTALPNRDQTTVSAPPVVNETKSEITDGTQPSTKQLEAKNPVIPVEKNQDDEPIGNKESKVETSTPEIKEKVIDKTGQDQINKLDKPNVISEPTEQPYLTQNITNKESVNQEQEKPDSHDKPVTTHTNIRMCTVQLEILTEVYIMKHVHVHKETESKTAPPAKPSELMGTVGTVETVEMVHFTRSRTKTKSPRTNWLPRTASSNIAYVHQDEQSDSGSSPSPKRKWNSRPKREPSSSCIKADSFSTKSPSVRPLRRSTRTANSQSPSTNQVPTISGTGNMTSPPVSTAASSDAENISKGTFTTQVSTWKRVRNPARSDANYAIQCVIRTRSLLNIISWNTIYYIVMNALKHSITRHPWPNISIHTGSYVLNAQTVMRSLLSKAN